MTINDLKTLLDAATPGPWIWYNGCSWWRLGTAERHDAVICPCKDRDGHPNLSVKDRDKELITASRALLPAFLRLWEAAEKMSDYIEDDGTGPYFPNPSTAHALLFSMHATLQELRDTKGTQ